MPDGPDGAPHTELLPPAKMEVGTMLLPHISFDLLLLGVLPRLAEDCCNKYCKFKKFVRIIFLEFRVKLYFFNKKEIGFLGFLMFQF